MKNIFNGYADLRLDTWADWIQVLLWFAGLIAGFGISWWATRRAVLGIAGRSPQRLIESVIPFAVGFSATAGVLAFSPMPAGLTLAAAGLALGLAAAAVGPSLVGYDHSGTAREADGVAPGAEIVPLSRIDDGEVSQARIREQALSRSPGKA